MTTPSNLREKEIFVTFERHIQKQLDIFYKQLGYSIARNGDKQKDLLLNHQKIEEKIRSEKRDDILVEILQDIVSFAPGWLYTVQADYLHYIMCQDRLAVMLHKIKWSYFKSWFIEDYFKKCPRGSYVISSRGWGLTLNIPVKIFEIPADMIEDIPIIEQQELF